MTSPSEWQWLASTRELQETAYGVDFSQRQEGAELANNLVHQGFALIMELAEAFNEVQWKDWAQNRGQLNRDAMLGEMVDVGHFIANILVHLGVTDEEWEAAYRGKQERNRARQAVAGGYDARGSKCRNRLCKRELDQPGSTLWSAFDNALRCRTCRTIMATMSPSGDITWYHGVNSAHVWKLPHEYVT